MTQEERMKRVLALPYGKTALKRLDSILSGRVMSEEEVKRRKLKVWGSHDLPNLPVEVQQDRFVGRILLGLED